jgi:hypothetical protein
MSLHLGVDLQDIVAFSHFTYGSRKQEIDGSYYGFKFSCVLGKYRLLLTVEYARLDQSADGLPEDDSLDHSYGELFANSRIAKRKSRH